jgi:citrate synthase
LHAEHSLNNSTFVTRVIGSTNASIYSSVSGAVGSLSGNLHGGANERVLRMLYSIGHPDNVEKFVEEQLSFKNRIMGIGHRVYKVKDPRAGILQELIPELIERRSGEEVKTLYNTALRLEEVVKKRLGDRKIYPNVDFYSGIVLEALGIPIDLFTAMFAMARSAGWCAHWLEQVSANRLFRPIQEYIGDHRRPYVLMEKR